MKRPTIIDTILARAAGRDPWTDLLRGAASLCLFNMVFFSRYMETRFYLPESSGILGEILARLLAAAVYAGVPAMDMLLLLSGFYAYRQVIRGEKTPLSFLEGRYRRFLPLFLAVSIPSFVYNGASLGVIVSHILLVDMYSYGNLAYHITSTANYYIYFSFLCAASLCLGENARRLYARLWFPALAAVAAGLAIALLDAPKLINFHFLGFFYGAFAAALLADERPRLFAVLRSFAFRAACVLAFILYLAALRQTRGEELVPLMTRTDGRTFLLLTCGQVLALASFFAFTGPFRFSGAISRFLRLLGMAGLSFFLSWSLYGMVLGASLRSFDQPTTFTMLFYYASVFCVSLIMTFFFYRFFECSPYSRTPPKAPSPTARTSKQA